MTKLYETYHANRKLQKHLIWKNDFTYRHIIKFIDMYITNGDRILDIGCGTGTIDFYIANKYPNCLVDGYDISKKGISVANLNKVNLGFQSRINYFLGDFMKLKLTKKYDVIICSEILEHIKNDNFATGKIYKLAKKGGLVIASSPSINAPLHRMGKLKKFDEEVGHIRRYDIKSYKALFKSNKFKILATQKTEGILRNFLFTNNVAGKTIRLIKGPLSDIVTYVDNLTVRMFGESQLFIIAKKT